MKPFLICLIFLTACKATGGFITPNEIHGEKVTLLLNDQSKLNGTLSVEHENSNSLHVTYNEYFDFIPEGKDSTQRMSMYNMQGYWYKTDFYAVKKVDIQMNGTFRLLFVKRLTGEHSKMDLYELYESGRGNYSGNDQYSYYISIPGCGPYDAINTRSSVLVPSFGTKMSLLVEDCPALAQKVLAHDKGYFIPLTSFNAHKYPEVLLRIISEYNQCN